MGVDEIAQGGASMQRNEDPGPNRKEGLDQEDEPSCPLSQHSITYLLIYLLAVLPRRLVSTTEQGLYFF